MPLKESYVIWNNKGGVGKTTLTFHMATRYASRNPGVHVLVIDLCPQANVSMALLSSPEKQGNEHLSKLFKEEKTISAFLQKIIEMGPVLDAKKHVTRVCNFNKQVPTNLFLLCGDMCLELVGRGLDHQRLGMDMPRNKPWKHVTTSIRSFIEGLPEKITGVTESRDEWVVFIDTNPSFAVYTEIALAAANKLIIPINADDFCKEALRAMLDLVYGITSEEEPEDFSTYRGYMFSNKARKYDLKLPEIHLLINNRTTTIKTRSAKAFNAMGEENLKVLFDAYQQHQREKKCFAPRETEIADIAAFQQQYFQDVQDFHTTAILSIHTGCPLAGLSGKVSFSEGMSVKVDQGKVKEYLVRLDNLVQKL